mmetsp:Transcript_28957/g.48867  ORF Transcript_28957/g.48867 Transcript_28957/m.48867 type:complete len:340 (-) Transcript_28957:168-1187(-)|eukprot:CAMPEP_0114434940 /NCGR_PEP_ID=MMETSP0103-20121206/12547_1 /TAXON_ID=37642 ORGANISM="Paraphysomonas imperforata, Strain PA2" /NCGR_SAMPLE_ID=MMETSP0103 /ASSEMBLY_ACC=CAM_ASM_000201 /LENGTH=339 /DNA_ID=CAMNT_0001604897 /DNA_START=95 /DNA_END=1114 /DNA_ORIENTATION=+
MLRSTSCSEIASQDLYETTSYVVFAGHGYEQMGERMQELYPSRFHYMTTSYDKFPDGTDDITISGFTPKNMVAGKDVVFLSALSSNDATLSQFSVLIVLLQSFIRSLTIVLPYYPVGTMDRVDVEGKVATASTYATILSSLPSCGTPARLMIYDIHALQERFYFHQNVVPSLHSGLPLLRRHLLEQGNLDISAVVFPDDGAAKRFAAYFISQGYEIITCGKHRVGSKRNVTIQDGDPAGKNVMLIDDLIQTGGTLLEAARVLKQRGAKNVYAYVTHAIFPLQSWKKFLFEPDSDPSSRLVTKFFVTDSVPATTSLLPTDNVFEVLDLLPQIVADLDFRE